MKLLTFHRNKLIFGIFAVIAVGFVVLASYPLLFDDKKTNNKNVNISKANQSSINNQIDTSVWQTYQSEELGFEMKYPPGWKVVLTDPEFMNGKQYGVVFIFQSNNQSYRLTITKIDNPLKLSSKELTIQSLKDDPSIRYESASEIYIGSYNAYALHRVFAIDEYDEQVLLTSGDRAYRFIYPSSGNNPNIPENEILFPIAEKMLSTFHSI